MANLFSLDRHELNPDCVTFREGIPLLLDAKDRYYLPIRLRKGGAVYEVDSSLVNVQNSLPLVSEASLLEGTTHLVPKKDGEKRTFVFFSCFPGMIFAPSGRSKPHFSEASIWQGADGPGMIAMEGNWGSPHVRQLFGLMPGETLLFADSHREITAFTAQECGKPPRFLRATESQVAEYILGQARSRGKDNMQTRAWAFYALSELGCTEQLYDFAKLYPEFKKLP
jgi:hypothetical protein